MCVLGGRGMGCLVAAKGPPLSPSYENLHECGTTWYRSKNTKIVVKARNVYDVYDDVILQDSHWCKHFYEQIKFLINYHKLWNKFMIKVYIYIYIYIYILSRVYSLFQQRIYTKNNTWFWKVLTLQRPVQILKKYSWISIPDTF